MNKHIYTVGAVALALAMSGLPALAENGGGEDNAVAQVGVQARGTDVSATGTIRVGEREKSSGDQQKQKMKEQENQFEATSSNGRVESSDRATSTEKKIKNESQDKQEIELELEDDSDIASSLDDLKQRIEDRRQELDDKEASTTPKFREVMKKANEVRLAVHALLASRDLFSNGIGQQVSEIAKHMNDSVASTTNAEAKIQSRGFVARLFFGGDSVAADVIAQEVAQNQQRIDDLTKLLGEANVSADIQVVLKAQITALQTAQARLQTLAEKEKSRWGIFSWRFF